MTLPGTPIEKPDLLYHFSENPAIEVFVPRLGRAIEGRVTGEKLVWAIDERHSPMYLFPRECPRIILWACENSDPEDIDRWIGASAALMVAHVESAWAERIKACQLFRYTLDATSFESIHDHGTHVSPEAVTPLSVEPVGDLRSALAAANVELREMASLQTLANAWRSSIHFSGIRLRNASDWTAPG